MTKRQLRDNVLFVVIFFIGLLFTACLGKFYLKCNPVYDTIKDFSSLIIAKGAAYLAYCFQRRQAFLVALRDLWKEMVEAKCQLIEFTHHPQPDQSGFNKAHRSLSRVIDSVRGVYRNVGETENAVGLYPLEPLHDMRRTLDKLGWTSATPDAQRAARSQIIQSWNALRWTFLKEFAAPEPPDPITHHGAADPRRPPRRP